MFDGRLITFSSPHIDEGQTHVNIAVIIFDLFLARPVFGIEKKMHRQTFLVEKLRRNPAAVDC